ncbi:MAG: N-acetylglucosamine-6-phosphate deacetylase [Candidatus Sumerlaeaceae bacterium]
MNCALPPFRQPSAAGQMLEGIACRRLFTPEIILDDVLITFSGGAIEMMGEFASQWIPPNVFDARAHGLTVVPGLIDVHIHGCGGADFLDLDEEAYRCISETAARGGATSIVATTTIPRDDTELERFGEFVRLIRRFDPPGARFLGIFLEGPFINPDKRGGFGPKYVWPADLAHAERILSVCEDLLLKITIAPEIDGGEALLEFFHENPRTTVEISLGHSSADYDLARKLFRLERVRQVTHAFNAMHPFHHRAPGLIGAALLEERVWCEMIPDGHHLSGPAIALLHRLKGWERLMIVTDGTGATATTPGTRIHSVGGWTEVRDGAVRLLDGTLAGSNLLMAGAVKSACELGGIEFHDALRMATLTPARSVHCDDRVGSVEPRKRADFCVLDERGDVLATIRDGKLVYLANEARKN